MKEGVKKDATWIFERLSSIIASCILLDCVRFRKGMLPISALKQSSYNLEARLVATSRITPNS